jgi:hypothetical protein
MKRRAGVCDDGQMLLNDAVKYVMKMTGRTRRQAEQAILQHLKSGSIRSRGELVVEDRATGKVKSFGTRDIPAEFYRSIPSEH